MSPSQISKFSTSNYQTSKLAFEANMSAAGALDSDLNALKSNLQAATVLFAGISAPLLLYLFKDNIRRSEIIYRLLWVGAFALNLITVSIGGRFDSDQVSQSGAFFWKTLFVPAGYAFAIWGIIYLSEIFLTAYVGVVGQPSSLLKKAVPFWTLANVFQSLWCFVFRPKYLNSLWLPTSQLAFGAVSLSFAHQALSQALIAESNWIAKLQLFVLRFPITLHTGWLTAASLLNLNSWAAVSKLSVGSQATVAFASAYIAGFLAVIISIWRKDPFLALTIAWALGAVAYKTKTNCEVLDAPRELVEALWMTEEGLVKMLQVVAAGVAVFEILSHFSMFSNVKKLF